MKVVIEYNDVQQIRQAGGAIRKFRLGGGVRDPTPGESSHLQ
jgi:hypothetical protein